MDQTRRSFLRSIILGSAGLAAAPLIKPKSFFSFFTGALWKPKPIVYEGVFQNGTVLTLVDIARRMPNDPAFAKIADLLAQPNTILDDIIWMPSNETMSIRVRLE